MKIPRAIYQTVSDKKSLSSELTANMARLQSMHPGWTYRLFDEADRLTFIQEQYGSLILSRYKQIDRRYGAARADFFRYLLLYRWGGVYLDIKSTVVRPLDAIIRSDDEYLLSYWHKPDGSIDPSIGRHVKDCVEAEFQQWHIAAAPGHPFLAAVIDQVSNNICRYNPWEGRVGARGVFRNTGPICYTLAILPLLPNHKHRFVNSQDQGFRYSCLSEDATSDRHRRILPNYRELRFPLVRPQNLGLRSGATYLSFMAFGHLHSALTYLRVPQTLVRWKKAIRARRSRRNSGSGA